MTIKILYEDNHIIAVDKTPGIPAQLDITGVPSLLCLTKEYIKEKYNKPGNVFLGLVHRLDKPVSGIIIFARTSKAARRLHSQLLDKSIKKFYIAIVKKSNMTSGEKWIELKDYIRKQRGYSEIVKDGQRDSKEARLRFLPIVSAKDHSLLLIQLITGRKHQIRAQLNRIGSPIEGDTTYSERNTVSPKEIMLHSYCMSLHHPVTKEILILNSDIPERFHISFPIEDNVKIKIDGVLKTVLEKK